MKETKVIWRSKDLDEAKAQKSEIERLLAEGWTMEWEKTDGHPPDVPAYGTCLSRDVEDKA